MNKYHLLHKLYFWLSIQPVLLAVQCPWVLKSCVEFLSTQYHKLNTRLEILYIHIYTYIHTSGVDCDNFLIIFLSKSTNALYTFWNSGWWEVGYGLLCTQFAKIGGFCYLAEAFYVPQLPFTGRL